MRSRKNVVLLMVLGFFAAAVVGCGRDPYAGINNGQDPSAEVR